MKSAYSRTQRTNPQSYRWTVPPITYCWTSLLILDHSYLVGNLTNSKISETKALEPLESWHFGISNFRTCYSPNEILSGPRLGVLSNNRWSGVRVRYLSKNAAYWPSGDLTLADRCRQHNTFFYIVPRLLLSLDSHQFLSGLTGSIFSKHAIVRNCWIKKRHDYRKDENFVSVNFILAHLSTKYMSYESRGLSKDMSLGGTRHVDSIPAHTHVGAVHVHDHARS
jgi:hypothetical protein